MRYLLLLATASALLAASEMRMNLEQLKAFIQSAVKLKQPDVQVAQYLHNVKLTEKLDDRTVETLQGMGAGPKTVTALRGMVDATASLPEAAAPAPKPVYVPKPPPDLTEQGKILDQVREYVMNYTKNLPNFICLQVTRRDVDTSGKGAGWRHQDTITARLTYDGHEVYDLVSQNDQPVTNKKMDELGGGAVSTGEFGSMMKEIFEPDSQARFDWDHWGTLRGRPTYVFTYDIEQENSKYHIKEMDTKEEIVPAYRGLIYVDRESKMVTKITMDAYDIPATFPIHEAHETLDYQTQKIADSDYMLPLKAELIMRSRSLSRNDIEFRLYRKFETGSTIKFDTSAPDPLPDDQTKEAPQPDKTPKKP
jgi:hypothetical protein